jgi:serine/threonine-protein kinase
MAEIFVARESSPGGGVRHLALKVLKRRVQDDQEGVYFEELFQREGRTAMLLAHPNIGHVYEFGKIEDRFFIAMEWIAGRSLSEVLARLQRRGEACPPILAAAIVAEMADALHYAHNLRDARNRPLQVVHRDVNPQNIMLRYDGSVKLLDFGVAHVDEPEQDSRAGTLKGKLSYIAPEQLLRQQLDCRADVFALGVCLHEALAGASTSAPTQARSSTRWCASRCPRCANCALRCPPSSTRSRSGRCRRTRASAIRRLPRCKRRWRHSWRAAARS